MSYPIYVLDLGGDDYAIVLPEDKVDIDHTDFWEATVARIVARHFHLPVEELLNLPYCQRRARINDKIVYYGERPTKKLLRQIEKAVGETGLEWGYDDHEKRLEYDPPLAETHGTGDNRRAFAPEGGQLEALAGLLGSRPARAGIASYF